MTTALDVFDQHRRLLFTVAYQMLGSVADAEDTVQDAWLRWSARDRSDVTDQRAYLVQIVSRLALDRLGSARARRESYVGPWLPEPLLTGAHTVGGAPAAPDPTEAAELGEQVSMAMLLVLETLSPAERAVFVLREVFGMSVAEVAAALGRSEAAVRQTAHRAREHVQARRPRFDADRRLQQEVTERFFAACAGGDVEALVALLAPDVVLISDGGGKTKAALRPILGADKVARFSAAVTAEGAAIPDLRIEISEVNGFPGIVAWVGTEPFVAVSLVVVGGVVEQVLVVRNPDKLAGLTLDGGGPDLGSPGTSPAGPHSARPEWHAEHMADDRWEQLVADAEGGDVTRGKMFGSEGLRTGTKFFAIWWNDQLVVKLPSDRLTELVDAGAGQPFEPMEGRRMNGWILLGDSADWPPVVEEARAFVESQRK